MYQTIKLNFFVFILLLKKSITKKDAIIEHIGKKPGLNFRELGRETGMANGILAFHLKKLEKDHNILVVRTSGFTRYFLTSISEKEAVLMGHLRQKTRNKLLKILVSNENGLTFKEIVGKSGMSSSTVSKGLTRLKEDNAIRVRRKDRQNLYQMSDSHHVRGVVNKLKNIVSKHIEKHKNKLTSLLFPTILSFMTYQPC